MPFPFPLGANGIAHRHGNIYVANTEKAHIVKIPIERDGSAGTPEIVAGGPELFVLDGIGLDVHGNIYAFVIGQSKLVRRYLSHPPVSLLTPSESFRILE